MSSLSSDQWFITSDDKKHKLEPVVLVEEYKDLLNSKKMDEPILLKKYDWLTTLSSSSLCIYFLQINTISGKIRILFQPSQFRNFPNQTHSAYDQGHKDIIAQPTFIELLKKIKKMFAKINMVSVNRLLEMNQAIIEIQEKIDKLKKDKDQLGQEFFDFL